MGVTVQLMVDAEVSGRDVHLQPGQRRPEHGGRQRSWGLGLAVVGGEVTPDDYLVSKVTREVVRETIARQATSSTSPTPDGRGAVRVDVPEERRAVRCLDEQAARRRSVDVARRVERHFGSPPGRRVGDRARRRAARRPVRRPVAPGDGGRRAAQAGARRRDVAGDGHVRREPAKDAEMGLTDEDVREILRIIDESDARRAADRDARASRCTCRRGARARRSAAAARRRRPARLPSPPTLRRRRAPRRPARRSTSPMLGTFYRAEAPGAGAVRRGRRPRRAGHRRLHHRGDEDDELGRRGRRGHDRRGVRRRTRGWSSTASRCSASSPRMTIGASSSPTAARSRCGSCAPAARSGSSASSAPPRSIATGWRRGWPTARSASARRRPARATCVPRSSSRPRSAPAATRSTPATASWPRTRGWPRSRARTGWCSSARRRR